MKVTGRHWKSMSGGAPWRAGAPGTVPFQGGHSTVTALPEPVARLIYEEYSRLYGNDQSFERLHERGGFGVGEAIAALADIIERERGSYPKSDAPDQGSERAVNATERNA